MTFDSNVKSDDALCRLCGNHTPVVASVNLFAEDQTELKRKCNQCLPICISETDGLSSLLCEACPKKVEDVHAFFSQVVQTTREQVTVLVNSIQSRLDRKEEEDGEGSKGSSDELTHISSSEDLLPLNEIDFKINEVSRVFVPLNLLLESSIPTSSMLGDVKLKTMDEDDNDCCDDIELTTFNGRLKDCSLDCSSDVADESGSQQNLDIIHAESSSDYSKRRSERVRLGQSPYQRRDLNENKDDSETLVTKQRAKKSGKSRKSCKRLRCETCNKGCNSQLELNYHVRTHQGLMPYNCHFCDKAFTLRATLQGHLYDHEGDMPFICELCGTRFRRKTVLMIHKRSVHTGEKPFKCRHCEKSFARSCVRSMHERIHSEPQYQCQHCEKAFFARDKLVVHMRIHTGERPYRCPHCNRGFCESGNLGKHMRVHAVKSSESVRLSPADGNSHGRLGARKICVSASAANSSRSTGTVLPPNCSPTDVVLYTDGDEKNDDATLHMASSSEHSDVDISHQSSSLLADINGYSASMAFCDMTN